MRIIWLAFLVAALPNILAGDYDSASNCFVCPNKFKGKLVCGFLNGCHMELEYCALVAVNCARILHHKHMILVKNEGRCATVRGHRCASMDF